MIVNSGLRRAIGLVLFLALSFGVAAAGGAITATSVGTWYRTIARPAFNPPDWVFAPVWSALFLLMAIAAWRVWLRRGFGAALWLWTGQLALNLGWSLLFFGLRAPGAALAEILLLLATIAATLVVFWRIDRLAGALFVPYLAWVSFATVLNAAIWRLNPG